MDNKRRTRDAGGMKNPNRSVTELHGAELELYHVRLTGIARTRFSFERRLRTSCVNQINVCVLATFLRKALLGQISGFRVWLSSPVEPRQKLHAINNTPSMTETALKRDPLDSCHLTRLPDTTLDSRAPLEIGR
jgi:hypothetical protein